MGTRLGTIIAVAAVVGLLASCAPAAEPEDPSPYLTAAYGSDGPGTAPGPGIFPIVPATHAHVQLWCPLVTAVHYDPGSIPVDDVDRVFLCTTRPYTDAPDGTPQIEEFVDRVAPDDIGALIEAYAEPDAERTEGPCDLALHDPLIIWLHHGDERITPVYAPQDECGFPSVAAAAVYNALDLRRVLVAREKMRTS